MTTTQTTAILTLVLMGAIMNNDFPVWYRKEIYIVQHIYTHEGGKTYLMAKLHSDGSVRNQIKVDSESTQGM